MKKIKNIATLVFSSLIFYSTVQAMEKDVDFYDEKSEMSFLMQAIQKKEPEQKKELDKPVKMVVEEKKVAIKAVQDYMCQRHGCRFSTTHENRITKHREMHRLENAFLSMKIYRCETCDYLTDTSRSMNEHKNSHNNERLYHCGLCDVSFKSIRSRDRHEKTKHKKQTQEKQMPARPLLVLNNGRI